MTDFLGLVAVVTGGASGIGAATARLLQTRGARVAVLDRSTDGAPDGVLALRCDLTDSSGVDEAVTTVVGELGGLDIVVNNAGIGAVGDVAQNDDAEWARVLDVNVIGIARVTRAALPHLRRSPHAAVVNTCSAVAFVGVSSGPFTAPARARSSHSPWPWLPTTPLRGSASTPWRPELPTPPGWHGCSVLPKTRTPLPRRCVGASRWGAWSPQTRSHTRSPHSPPRQQRRPPALCSESTAA